jgi:hypothetical protein
MSDASGSVTVVRLATSDERLPLKSLGVSTKRPVIALAGTASNLDPQLAARLYPFIHTLMAAAAEHDAVIVTGGTDAGVIRLMGRSRGSLANPPTLIGVAPGRLVAPDGEQVAPGGAHVDPNHDAVLLVPGTQWGDETPMLSRLVGEIAGDQPAVVVVIGGGAGALAEVIEHARHKRSIVVVSRSGRLADELAELRRRVRDGNADDSGPPISLRDVHVIDLAESPSRVRSLLDVLLASSRRQRRRGLRQRFPVLSVWPRMRRPRQPSELPFGLDAGQLYPQLHDAIVDGHREVFPHFAECDQEAIGEQQRYRLFVVAAMIGGFGTTVFGALQAALPDEWWPGVVVATVGASTTALTTVARRQGALDSYLQARLRAERLRSLYVSYVATAPGVDAGARHELLRRLQADVALTRFGKEER